MGGTGNERFDDRSSSTRGDSAPRRSRGTSLGTKLSVSIGITAAMVLAVLVNVYVARHYKRWDWTTGGLYTLSEPTVLTLRSLEEPIKIYVLLSADDPLTLSVQHLLEAYQAETSRLQIQVTDPDRYPAEFLAVQQRYGIVAGKTVDGRIVTDASIIVARGDKPYFLTTNDLVEVEDEEDLKARPRLEQALTGAIRNVLSTERPKICFTVGHGEKSIDAGGAAGLLAFKDRLIKNNYDVDEVGTQRTDPDDTAPETPQPGNENLSSCHVLIMAGPMEPVPATDVAKYRAFIEAGGNALLAVGPVPDANQRRYLPLGLADLLAVAGVKLEDDFIFEQNPELRDNQGFGETFSPIVKPHPITEGLLKRAEQGLGPIVKIASSLTVLSTATVTPVPLLATSDQAFGMIDFFGWAEKSTLPEKTDIDHKGPLTIGFATELSKPKESNVAHGPRVVVISTPSLLAGENWQRLELRGNAILIENAMSWLAARPLMLDIPNKPTFTAGMRISEDSINDIFRYVVIYIPLAFAFLGGAVRLQRRSEARGKKNPSRS